MANESNKCLTGCGNKVFASDKCKRCYNAWWRATFPEKMKRAKSAWNKANPDKLKAQAKRKRERYPNQSKENLRTPKGRYSYSKSKAKTLGQTWDIPFNVYEYLISLPCHYCGEPLNPTSKGLDRVDSAQGYHSYNVVPCCKWCNIAKGDRPVDEFLAWAFKVVTLKMTPTP